MPLWNQKNNSNNNNDTYLTVACQCTLYGMGLAQQKLKQARTERLLYSFLASRCCLFVPKESTKTLLHIAAIHFGLSNINMRDFLVLWCVPTYILFAVAAVYDDSCTLRLLKFGCEHIYLHTKKYTTQKPEHTHRRARACIRAKNAREGSPIPSNWAQCMMYVFAAFVCDTMCERDRTNVCLSKPELLNECGFFFSARPWGVSCT